MTNALAILSLSKTCILEFNTQPKVPQLSKHFSLMQSKSRKELIESAKLKSFTDQIGMKSNPSPSNTY